MPNNVKNGVEIVFCANSEKSERKILLRADYDDISAYHGGRYPAGTALGQKALELAHSLLFPQGGCFVRGECSLETPFAGKGFEDALEMVLRCTSLGRYTLDLDMPVPQGTLSAPVKGKFFYRFSQGDGFAELAVKPGLVPEEFYKVTEDLHRGKVTAEDQALELRRKIEDALMALDPDEIFDVHGHRPLIPQEVPRDTPPHLKDDFRLRLVDYGEYAVGIEQLRRYHGNRSLCGLCLAWSLIRQWARMEGWDELPRRSVHVRSGALGDGISDALEFLFRGKDGRVVVDTAWGDATPAPKVMPGSGAFAFQLSLPSHNNSPEDSIGNSCPQPSRTFILKEKAVPKEYLRLSRIHNENPGEFREHETRKALQLEFACAILEENEPFEAEC
jgi:hypothetical protein